ncbi:ABC transporter, permease protein [Desulfitobacterium hafniense DP7]|uniref:ABC transporter, permease protein n=2 Tax=Desulfitobacterium hafniense TaxID=49338 RepID=G9XWP3_DESHA|nr:ABC transporter, permease protein [Desulfitobacterium hafniense DP7]
MERKHAPIRTSKVERKNVLIGISSGMTIIKELLRLVAVIFGVITLSFCLQLFTGTDPAEMIVRKQNIFATEAQIQAVREELKLDAPFQVRYLDYLGGVVRGDLGTAIMNRRPVAENIREVLPVTTMLILLSMLWVVLFSIVVAAAAVLRKDRAFDNVTRIICIIGICVPSFWLGLILLAVFAVRIPIFQVIADGSLKSFILPSIAMAFPIICISIRVLRASVLNELNSDYVTYARARGFTNGQIIYGEVLKNALPPAITLFAQYCAALFGTSALVESVFSIRGLGIYLMESCESMDVYGISGAILVCAVLFVLFNIAADLLSSAVCPAYGRKRI